MASADLQKAVEQSLVAAAQKAEIEIDSQLKAINDGDSTIIQSIRNERLEQLKRLQKDTQEWLRRGHGSYEEVFSEKDFFETVKGEERAVCHFFRENWPCKVVDKHLKAIASRHIETKFFKLNAEKSPYLVERLKLWMLPTLALILSGKTVGYIVGFDELGGRDDFSTQTLIERLRKDGLLHHHNNGARSAPSVKEAITHSILHRSCSDEDSDFD